MVRLRSLALALMPLAVACVGGQPQPDPGAVRRVAETLAYQQQVVATIRAGWQHPAAPPGLAAIVIFGIGADGAVGNIQLVQSSGDTEFDDSALRAVERQRKLPPPPQHAAAEVSRFEMYFSSR